MNSEDTYKKLKQLYQKIDQKVKRLHSIHGNSLTCHKGCNACCIDDLTVFKVEAENIKINYAAFLSSGLAAQTGRCAFQSNRGECRIYPVRPYVCRTQGLPLRWLEETDKGSWVEYRDICPLNEPDKAVENLDQELCWELGPYEGKLAHLQAITFKGQMTRIPLRDLFQT